MEKKIETLNLAEGRVLIKPKKEMLGNIEIDKELQSGQMPVKGIIIDISEDLGDILEIADTVYYRKYSPDKVEIDGEELFFVDAKDILAVEI